MSITIKSIGLSIRSVISEIGKLSRVCFSSNLKLADDLPVDVLSTSPSVDYIIQGFNSILAHSRPGKQRRVAMGFLDRLHMNHPSRHGYNMTLAEVAETFYHPTQTGILKKALALQDVE